MIQPGWNIGLFFSRSRFLSKIRRKNPVNILTNKCVGKVEMIAEAEAPETEQVSLPVWFQEAKLAPPPPQKYKFFLCAG